MASDKSLYEHNGIPVGPLKIIAVDGCQDLMKKVDDYIVEWRRDRSDSIQSSSG